MAENTPTPDPWADQSRDFEISGVRIVATIGSNGGAIVENVRKLYCTEGRLYSFERQDDHTELHQLEYHFGFAVSDEPEPYPSKSVEARIIITGRHSNGLRLEVRGEGSIGYDDRGRLEGRFSTPPVIITEDSYPEPEEPSDETESPELTAEIFNFPMPPQFVQANVRVSEKGVPYWMEEDD